MFRRKDSAARTLSQVRPRSRIDGDSAGMQPRLELVEQLKAIDTIDSVPGQFVTRHAKEKEKIIENMVGKTLIDLPNESR